MSENYTKGMFGLWGLPKQLKIANSRVTCPNPKLPNVQHSTMLNNTIPGQRKLIGKNPSGWPDTKQSGNTNVSMAFYKSL